MKFTRKYSICQEQDQFCHNTVRTVGDQGNLCYRMQ
jgi:hypothetical protein